MLRTIKEDMEVRYGGKHKYIPEDVLYRFYEDFKFHIKGHIKAEFYDKNNDLCVSLDKKKMFALIEKLNTRSQ